MTGRLCVLASLGFVLAIAGHARAQPAPDPADPGEAAYLEGRRHYDLGEWDEAIASFKEAYRLRSDAPSLFNIGQSYRLKGDCVEASRSYRAYRRNFPDAPNLAKVDKFIAELEPCVQERAAAAAAARPTPPAPVPVAPVGPATADTDRAPAGRGGARIGAYVAFGIGAAGLGLGIVSSIQGRNARDDLRACLAVPPCDGAERLRLEDDGNAANTRAYIGYAVAGAGVITGVVLYLVSRGGGRRVAVTPIAGGAVFATAWAF